MEKHKGGGVNFLIQFSSKCGQRGRGQKIRKKCGHHIWKLPSHDKRGGTCYVFRNQWRRPQQTGERGRGVVRLFLPLSREFSVAVCTMKAGTDCTTLRFNCVYPLNYLCKAGVCSDSDFHLGLSKRMIIHRVTILSPNGHRALLSTPKANRH